MINAPYSGGSAPYWNAGLYHVDGDFTVAEPCGPPVIQNQFRGDSMYSIYDIVLMGKAQTPPAYVRVPIGEGYNIQGFHANQASIVFEQEFMVAQSYFRPMPLNSPYYVPWSIGWQNTYVWLGQCFLVEEGPLEDQGGGICKFRRKFANLPPSRNVFESYAYTFPAIIYDSGTMRFQKTIITASRVQYDYFVMDDLNILSIPVFPVGRRLNNSTGMRPEGLLFPEMLYYKGEPDAVVKHNLLDPGQGLSDSPATTPTRSQYLEYVDQYCEIVVEASQLSPYMGNILERRTRFALAQ